ncbi:MAG: Gfo/Idh/MocA family oxidoreductase [Gemmatimonadota bacterium]|nr:Gfo/Idh/MocA family oxidoreductase [Gemmatimonadota bacterium]
MRVRTGVIGAGGLGIHHIRILRDLQGPDFIGFFESRPERAAQVSNELGVRAFGTLDDLLDQVDAVTIVVPTPGHYAVAQQVLARGIHAMIEKPLAATLEEADAMLALAREHGAVLQTGHVERFNRAIRAALPFVDAPRFIESDRLSPFNPRGSDVAVVLDLMIHDIDLVHTLVGGKASSVSAVGVPVLTPFVDIANARLTFESGAVANITASRVSRERMRKIRIFQQSGYLSLDLAAGSGEFFRLRGDVDVAALAMAPLVLEQFVERIPVEAEDGEPLRLEFESFLAAVRGESSVVVTGEAGREALAVALQIVRDIERTMPSSSNRPLAGPRA